MKVVALNRNVFLKPIELDVDNPFGLILPNSSKNLSQLAEVVYAAEDCERVKAGMKVAYHMGFAEFPFRGETYLIGKEANLLAIIE